jgi:hypothetical protein
MTETFEDESEPIVTRAAERGCSRPLSPLARGMLAGNDAFADELYSDQDHLRPRRCHWRGC